ncbi:MAG: chemotaxis protein CheX [Bdellovibrio sp.]
MNTNKPLFTTFVNEITNGVNQTFSQMLGVKPQAMPPVEMSECRLEGDVSGLISVVGQDVNGVLLLTFPKETIFALLEKIYRKKIDSLNPSVKSGVGELTNVVFGVLKTSLNKQGFGIKMAIPSVILGDQHTVISVGEGPHLMMPFKTDKGNFSVMIGLADGETQINNKSA